METWGQAISPEVCLSVWSHKLWQRTTGGWPCSKKFLKEVKDALFEDDSFNLENSQYSCIVERNKGFGTFYLVYCVHCVQTKLSLFWEMYKQHLPDQPKIETLLDMWDELQSKEKSIGRKTAGQLTLPPAKWIVVNTFLNNRCFILRPMEHWNLYHTSDLERAT